VAELFVDTSAWYPLVVADHPDRAAVAAIIEDALRAGTRLVTTNLVVAETHALLLHRTNRQHALAFVRAVSDPSTIVESSTADLEHVALTDWLARYADQDFSLADAVSFAVMKRRNIARAATLNQHFAVAGFEVEPKPKAQPRRRRG
jgi:predicted nucleic acid-binding protein